MTTITDDTPLRLETAAKLAFPGGGVSAASLRTEARRGRLAIERIAAAHNDARDGPLTCFGKHRGGQC